MSCAILEISEGDLHVSESIDLFSSIYEPSPMSATVNKLKGATTKETKT